MNEIANAQRWGMCSAYGCPLLGTVSTETGGRWWCYCHLNKPTQDNDKITAMLRDELAPIVQTTLEIRKAHGSFFDVPDVYRNIQQRLVRLGLAQLMFNADNVDTPPTPESGRVMKPVVRMWLDRLERFLVDETGKVSATKPFPATVSTGAVIGPTHAMQHFQDPR